MTQEYPFEELANLTPLANHPTSTQSTQGKDVFIRNGVKPVLYSASNTHDRLGTDQLEQLVEKKAGEVYIKTNASPDPLGALSTRLVKTLDNPSIPITQKYATLYAVTTEAVELTLNRSLDVYSAEALSKVLDASIPFMIDSLSEITLLFKLLSRDYSTFSHSVSVFAYSVAIAGWQGLHDRETLHNLGFGAILHDIGKSMISNEILNKPGALSTIEWDEMQKHPQYGERLLQNATLPDVIQEIVVQHHERADGSGYPYRLPAGFINPLAEIVAVSDVFDALTKDRPYRQAYQPLEALQIMSDKMNRKLNSQAFRSLVLLLGGRHMSRS
jgi:putative nucleotidyltransferase with HDIG domain